MTDRLPAESEPQSELDPEPEPEPAPGSEPPRRSGFFLYVVPAVLYVCAIFYGGMTPRPIPPLNVKFADKWMHLVAFGFMVLVLRRAIAFQLPRLSPRQVLVLSVVGVSLLGAALEFAQLFFTTTRSAELLDWIADTLGAILAAVLIDRLVLASPRSAR